MAREHRKHGVVLITVVFVAALLAAIVMGMLQIHTEEIQVMRNHIRAAESLAIAEAGLNDALAQLRTDAAWDKGYVDKGFAGGMYTVTVNGSHVTSLGTSSHGFVARVEADVTVSSGVPPHVVEIDSVKVNE
jgi:type II secretory pathway component PulK